MSSSGSSVIDEWVNQVTVEHYKVIDARVRLLIKPAPRLIPENLWIKLACKFIVLEVKDD